MRSRACTFCGEREQRVTALVAGPGRAVICDQCVDLASGLVKERLTPGGDMVLGNIGRLATNNPRFQGMLGIITDAALAVRRGRVAWAGPAERLPSGLESLPRIDCEQRTVMPGLIDAHTHLLFGGERSREFALLAAGIPETKAIMQGGGAAATARATQVMDVDAFADLVSERLNRMLEFGTTTVEASAGFSANHQDELNLLRVADMIQKRQPVDLIPTFNLSIFPSLGSERERIIAHLTSSALPGAARKSYGLRVSHGGRFPTYEEGRDLLEKGAALGMPTKVHREGDAMGQAHELALETNTPVVDHCDAVDARSAAAMGRTGIAVVITPVTALARQEEVPAIQELIACGVPVAIGTDCGPSPVMNESLPLAISLAVLGMGLTPDQAIWSATRGSAIALGLEDRGWIGPGAIADLLILDAPHPDHLTYRPGADLTWKVLKAGSVVVSR